jgi:hypothetical protein
MTARPKNTRRSDQLSQHDAEACLRNFPFPGYPALALHALFVIACNGYVFWLLVSGQLPAAGLILLVAIECSALLLLLQLLAYAVPPEHWADPPDRGTKRLALLGFLIVWCGGAYGLTLVVIDGWRDLLGFWQDLDRWYETGLAYALALTLGLALIATLSDWQRYRRIGPPFMPTASTDCMARMLTLIFGAIPFAVPFFVVAIGGAKLVEWLFARAGRDLQNTILGALCMLAAAYGSFFLVGMLIDAGIGGWAIGYVLAKILAELLVVALPLIMRDAAGSTGQVATPSSAAKGKQSRRLP